MISERNVYKTIPPILEPSWVVNYLEKGKFTPIHVRLLRAKTGASDKVLSSILNIAPKTLVSYTKDVSRTKLDTKEHILMLISLLKHGGEVFGTEENFGQWLDSKNVFLDNRKPMDFLSTISGIKMIDDRVTAIEYGDNV